MIVVICCRSVVAIYFCNPAQLLATRQQREHQQPDPPVLAQGQRPVGTQSEAIGYPLAATQFNVPSRERFGFKYLIETVG